MEQLSPLEVAVVGYYVYADIDDPKYDKRRIIASKLGKSETESINVPENLVSLGILTTKEFGYWYKRTSVKKEYIFQIIFYILEKYPEYKNIYQNILHYQPRTNAFYWNIAEAICKDDTRALQQLRMDPSWPYDESLVPFVKNFIFDRDFFPIISAMPQSQVLSLVNSVLEDNLSYAMDRGCFDRLDELVDYYVNYNFIDVDFLHDMVSAYRFLHYAEQQTWSKSLNGTVWRFAVEAIMALYRGELQQSGALFNAALKLHNKQSNDKNFFYSPILSFYLMLYYAKDGSTESRKKIEAFLKKPYLQKTNELVPAQIVADFIVLSKSAENLNLKGIITSYIKSFNGKPIPFHFGNLFSRYFDYSEDDVLVVEGGFKHIPACALLRYELSPYLPCADSDELLSALGGAPILHSLQRKEQWEAAIENILFSIATEPKDHEGGSSRIVYVINKYGNVEPKEQKWLKSNRWGTPSNVSYSAFISQTKECMDDIDRQISSCLNINTGELSYRYCLPFLVGSKRVLFCDGIAYHSVSVEEDKAFINIDESEVGFKISNNLPSGEPLDTTIVRKIDNTHYKVFKLTISELNVFKAIRTINLFPKKAEGALKDLISRLDGKIEIHSSLIEGGSTLEKKDGESILTLSLRPNAEQYQLSIFVRPLDGGSVKVIPGKGKDEIFDTLDGTRYQVSRDRESERTRYYDLIDFLEETLSAEPSEKEGCYVLGPSDMLELLDFVRDKSDSYSVEWPKGQTVKIKSRVASSSVKASLSKKEQWFEMEGEVKIDDETVMSLQKLLELYGNGDKSRFIKLSDGDFIALSESLRKQLRSLEDLATIGSGRIPVYQVGALAEMVHGKESILSVDKNFKTLEKKIEAAAKLNPEVPKTFQGELRDYQKEGFQWITRLSEWGAGACLADDMGLGKTIQSAAFMLYRASLGPSLIVAPASVVLNWASELAHFTPTLNVTILNEASSRKDVIDNARASDIVLCSYALMAREEDIITAKKWNVVCLDEAHTIKNRSTKMSMAAMKISAQTRLILTGTPIQNHLNELWNLFQFINPGLLGTLETFQQRYITGDNAADNSKRLRKVIQPFILRRRKMDVVDELPDKTEILRNVQMTDLETASYESMREKALQSLDEATKVDVKVLADITRLREASCSISLVDSTWNNGSSKIDTAIELINQIVEGGNRVLVFSQFTSFLAMVRDQLGMDNILYLDGKTPIRKRAEMVESFQNGQASVFFISLKAGGLGLNLTGANYVIHLDPWWNPAIEQQATDRAYRIGQEQNVTVYHLISAHTIEEKILRLHKTKKDMADALLEGTDVAKAISLDELRALVTV